MTTLVGPILQPGEWVSNLIPCCSLLKKLQIKCKKHEGPVPIPRMAPSAIQLGACQDSHNLDSAVRWTAMVLPYSQAQLLFISFPLKASEPFIGFLIKMCYLSLHSKVEKTGVGRGYLVALPMRLPGPPFPYMFPAQPPLQRHCFVATPSEGTLGNFPLGSLCPASSMRKRKSISEASEEGNALQALQVWKAPDCLTVHLI